MTVPKVVIETTVVHAPKVVYQKTIDRGVMHAPKCVIETIDHGVINPKDYGVAYAQPGVIPLHSKRDKQK